MLEIRFHGRGGQGTVVAATILAKAYFRAGYFVQTFPLFGVERRGAPVEAYLRIAQEKILVRSGVYKPDHVAVQDPKLLESVDITKGLKEGGWLLVNLPKPPEDQKPYAGYRLASIDASGIAVNHGLGTRTQPIINTALVGAFAKMMGDLPFADLEDAILEEIPVKGEQNVAAAREAFDAVDLIGSFSLIS